MKTDLNKQTKYFKNVFNSNKHLFELKEIPLCIDNWWYVQLDATIRTTFLKYGFPLPKYVVLDELTHYTIINVFRSSIKNEKELLQWKEKYIYVLDELKHQADFNSIDSEDDETNFIRYEFKLM